MNQQNTGQNFQNFPPIPSFLPGMVPGHFVPGMPMGPPPHGLLHPPPLLPTPPPHMVHQHPNFFRPPPYQHQPLVQHPRAPPPNIPFMIPPAPQTQTQNPPSDVWLEDFLKRHTSTRVFEWTGENVKQSVSSVYEKISTLRTIMKDLESKDATHPDIQSKIAQARKLKEEISQQSAFLSDEGPRRKFVSKVLKRQRAKKWLKKRVQLQKLKKANKKLEKEELNKKIDEWRAKKIAEFLAYSRKLREKAEARRRAVHEKRMQSKEEELKLVIQKLQELRDLRKEKLKRQGHVFPEDDNAFLDRIRAEVEAATALAEEQREEERQRVAQQLKEEQERAQEQEKIIVMEAMRPVIKEAPAEEASPPPPPPPVLPPPQLDGGVAVGEGARADSQQAQAVEWFNKGSRNSNDLIQIRQQWDIYIVPPGSGGSRIPPFFLEPPPPSNAVWASYVLSRPAAD